MPTDWPRSCARERMYVPAEERTRIADALSAGKTDAEPFAIRGDDEIAVLGNAFNRMRRSLEKALALLG